MRVFAGGPTGVAARVQAILKAARGAVRPELLAAASEAAGAVLPMQQLPEVASPEKTQARPQGLPVQVPPALLALCGNMTQSPKP